MIEKVARDIDPFAFNINCSVGPDCPECNRIRKVTKDEAKLAIEAMREPTDFQRNEYFRMKKASGCSERDSVFMDAEWERMIDAALKED